ncbi:MAG TPA: ABC transporter substrate-binding protein [Chloroflexota bacterium]
MRGLTRREFVVWLSLGSAGLLVAGCGSAASPQPTGVPVAAATTAPAAVARQTNPQGDWDALVAAATQEGKVVVETPVGEGYRQGVEVFANTFPGIQAEHQPFPDSATFIPRLDQERKAGIFTFDVTASTPIPTLQSIKPAGDLDPLRPLLMLPEVLDDKAWFGGFESRWADSTQSHVFRHLLNVTRSLFINTDLIGEEEIKTLDDLLDPRWKGKIVTSDVTQGYIYSPFTMIREQKGEDWIKRFFIDQEPQMIRDRRQAVETLVRGGAPIGFGLHPLVMKDFKSQGLANNIKNPEVPGTVYSGGDIVAVFNRAPHPNAAKLFINWLLSKDGQIAWSSKNVINSARTDVPVVDPDTAPGKTVYDDPTQEKWLPNVAATQEYLKKLVS